MTYRHTSVFNTTRTLYPLGFMSRCRFEKEPMSASQWTGLYCILRRYAASTMGVEGMEREK